MPTSDPASTIDANVFAALPALFNAFTAISVSPHRIV